MSTMSINIVLILVAAIVLSLNVKASLAIARDSLSEPMQRVCQLLLVWILPLIGALAVMSIHRRTEDPSRKYREREGPADELTGADIVGGPGGD